LSTSPGKKKMKEVPRVRRGHRSKSPYTKIGDLKRKKTVKKRVRLSEWGEFLVSREGASCCLEKRPITSTRMGKLR